MELRHGPMGHGAVEMLMKKIARPRTTVEPVAVPPTYHPGQTVSVAPSR